VCSVGVIVYTTVEDGGCILSNTRRNECLSTGVVLDEVGYIVDDTSNSNKGTAILGLSLIIFPADDRQLLQRNTPVKSLSLLVELLLQLLEPAFLNLILLKLLQVICETKLLPDPDRPLCRVILMPFDSIAVVRREFVVEIVVTLTKSDKSSDNMITGRVAVVEWLVAEPMSQGIDTEGGLLDEEDSEDTSVDESTHPVSPSKTSHEAREYHAHEDDGLDVVAMLPDDDRVIIQIGDIGAANSLRVLLHDHPSDVRVEEALSNRVWILVGIGVSVMGSVISGPPSD